VSQAPSSVSAMAAKCLRIAEYFSAIATELENFEDALASLDAREQGHVDDAPVLGLRRSKMSSTKVVQKFLSVAAVAERLGIDNRTLRRLRLDKAQRFPEARRIGSSLRWRSDEIEAWTERQKERV